MTLLLAGHETTAAALSWALYWIHYLPEVKRSCWQNWRLQMVWMWEL